MVERAVFLAAVAAVGVGLSLWVHVGAGLIGAGGIVVLDCWLPSPRRTGT